MRWVARGKTNAEIAGLLCTSTGTVRRHMDNVFAKLGVHTRTAAVAQTFPRLAQPNQPSRFAGVPLQARSARVALPPISVS